MSYLPLCLNLEGRPVLVIGGGRVALQKCRTLLQYGARVTVVAPKVSAEVHALPVEVREEAYAESQLRVAGLVYACTDDKEVNLRVAEDARSRGILANVADDPAHCDFTSPALYREGFMTVAVSSDARDVSRSVAWRNAIRDAATSGVLPLPRGGEA